MSICFEKARELARLILESSEAQALRLATNKLAGDEKITKMIDEFDLYRKTTAQDLESGRLSKAEEDMRADELARMYMRFENEPLFQAKKLAEAGYEGLINGVTDILNMTLGINQDKCAHCQAKSSCIGNCTALE